jgi:hypothetical protein
MVSPCPKGSAVLLVPETPDASAALAAAVRKRREKRPSRFTLSVPPLPTPSTAPSTRGPMLCRGRADHRHPAPIHRGRGPRADLGDDQLARALRHDRGSLSTSETSTRSSLRRRSSRLARRAHLDLATSGPPGGSSAEGRAAVAALRFVALHDVSLAVEVEHDRRHVEMRPHLLGYPVFTPVLVLAAGSVEPEHDEISIELS